MYLEGVAFDNHGDITVEALQPLLVQTLQDIVAKIGDRHLQRLSHNALPSTTGSAEKKKKKDDNKIQIIDFIPANAQPG